eukprot:6181207-Pleurochrysis_carterae.AAC.4
MPAQSLGLRASVVLEYKSFFIVVERVGMHDGAARRGKENVMSIDSGYKSCDMRISDCCAAEFNYLMLHLKLSANTA